MTAQLSLMHRTRHDELADQVIMPKKMGKGHGRGGARGERHPRWNGGKTMVGGYVRVFSQDHPRAAGHGYVSEHVLIAEKALGRFLSIAHPVHHVNEVRDDNRNENLVICENHAYHKMLHARTRALRESGHADWHMCRYCKQWDTPDNLYVPPPPHAYYYHRDCLNGSIAAKSRERREQEGKPPVHPLWRETHCMKGHLLGEKRPGKTRVCPTCHRDRNERYRERVRAGLAPGRKRK